MVVLAVVYIVAGICLMAALFALRRCFRDPPPEPLYPYLVTMESFRFGGTIFQLLSLFRVRTRLKGMVMNAW